MPEHRGIPFDVCDMNELEHQTRLCCVDNAEPKSEQSDRSRPMGLRER